MIIDESIIHKNKIAGITIVVYSDDNIINKIKKMIREFEIRYPKELLNKLQYHFVKDTDSFKLEVLNEISKFNIMSYSVIINCDKDMKIKELYENNLNNLLKPILKKYEKIRYYSFELDFENLTEKYQKDKEFILKTLSKDNFIAERIQNKSIIINIIKKENFLTILPDYIMGAILFFLKSKNKEPGSFARMQIEKIKKCISQVNLSLEGNLQWYDFKKQSRYDDFMKL